jgi:hypothetical protein
MVREALITNEASIRGKTKLTIVQQRDLTIIGPNRLAQANGLTIEGGNR